MSSRGTAVSASEQILNDTWAGPSRSDSLRSERGTALLTVLLMLTLSLAMLGGFMSTIVTDQQLRAVDQSRTKVFYATHGALEKLTADLGNLFITDFSPSATDVQSLTATPPTFDRVMFQQPDGSSGYSVRPRDPDADGNPVTVPLDIKSGPFQGFVGLSTNYVMDVTGKSADATKSSAEVRLQRELQTVAIPVFQFGIFSETDLSFFAGPNFNFGGRVHSNGNLFLASGNSSTLTMSSPVTAVREIIRTNLSNGFATSSQYTGTVRIARAPNSYRNLATSEGSLVGTLGSAQTNPQVWTRLSITDYNGYMRNSRTGARRLDLGMIALGGSPIDIIRRGVNGENAQIMSLRYYKNASIRIMLSDTAADLTGLPGVTVTAPLPLTTAAALGGGYTLGIPLASSVGNASVQTTASTAIGGTTITVGSTANFAAQGELLVATNSADTTRMTVTYTGKTSTQFTGVSGVTTAIPTQARWVRTNYATPMDTALHGGFIKIEIQRADETWQDVTMELLNLGFTGRNLAAATGGNGCAEPSPNAVIRLQRLRDNPGGGGNPPAAGGARCGNASAYATDYQPNMLYDTREANLRDNVDTVDTGIRLGGVMQYVELDVENLRRWFAGLIGTNGSNARSVNGYTVYFSDRRTNRNASNQETAEFGFEDVVNPSSASGTPNGVLDGGEDFNTNGVLDTYGQTGIAVTGSTGVFTNAARPWTLTTAAEARASRTVLFRRALKLTNGPLGSVPMPGFTVAAENPIYIQGNFNANGSGFGNPDSAVSVIADAVTLLSNVWDDRTSFLQPNNPGGRNATTTWYRMAVLAGKGRSFAQPTAGSPPQDFGTDGGAHNFLRYLENWSNQTLNFRGAIASFYYSRQAVGTFKCCTNVYSAPTRGYNFDTNFLTPALLPPFTPMFRDVNITRFSEIIE